VVVKPGSPEDATTMISSTLRSMKTIAQKNKITPKD
jgi:hypothetical protein